MQLQWNSQQSNGCGNAPLGICILYVYEFTKVLKEKIPYIVNGLRLRSLHFSTLIALILAPPVPPQGHVTFHVMDSIFYLKPHPHVTNFAVVFSSRLYLLLVLHK